MTSVKQFLSDLLQKRKQRGNELKMSLKLSMPVSEVNQASVTQARAGWAKELLRNESFQVAIQFMNEQIVHEIAATDPIDTVRLQMLRLKLETISEFPQVLQQFLDNYALIEAIQAEEDRRTEEELREYRQ